MPENRIVMVAVLWLLPLTAALANDAATVGDLSRIQAQTLLMKARAQEAAARSALTQKDGGAGAALPAVKMIVATRTQLSATLVYPDGSQVDVNPGDWLPGDYRVLRIDARKSRVVLVRGRHQTSIGMAVQLPAVPAPAMSLPGAPVVAPMVPGLVR